MVVERLDPARDLDGLLEVDRLSFTNPWTRDMFEWELNNSDVSHLYVIRSDEGRVVGYCACWLIFDELHINNVAVRPEMRRRGVARKLLTTVLREMKALGATRATLEVRASNEPAQRLYASFGFTPSGVRPRYYRNPDEDAVILWKTSLDDVI
jgi:ribosomal-protein-alanine N-acetyltransferase